MYNSYRFQESLTMDVIVSAAFGIDVDSQNNPDDPVLKAAQLAMNETTFQLILLGILSLIPLGPKIIEKVPQLYMNNLRPLLNIAEEIIRTKRENAGSSVKKVLNSNKYYNYYDQSKAHEKEKYFLVFYSCLFYKQHQISTCSTVYALSVNIHVFVLVLQACSRLETKVTHLYVCFKAEHKGHFLFYVILHTIMFRFAQG